MAGMKFTDDAKAEINGGKAVNNEGHGVEVSGRATVILNNFDATGNSGASISVGGNSNVEAESDEPDPIEKSWYEKPLGIIFLAVVAGLVLATLVTFFGLN